MTSSTIGHGNASKGNYGRVISTKSLTGQLFAKILKNSSVCHTHRLQILNHTSPLSRIKPRNTAADLYDPTRRTNYADTKSDLIRLLRSPYGKHEIEEVYNTHNKTSTIAGGAATRTTVQNAPNTTQHIGSIGQYRFTISQKSTGQNDSTDHKTRMERINKRVQEIQKTDKQLEFKQYTTRQRKQTFLLVHNSESYLQRASTDQILISIGMKASSIYEITGRPVPPTIRGFFLARAQRITTFCHIF
jgi:hypothetical protein